MSTTSFSPEEIEAAGRMTDRVADSLGSVPPVAPPPTIAFGKLLEPQAMQSFPFTTDGITSFMQDATVATRSVGAGLAATAAAYRAAEEAASLLAQSIWGGGGGTATPGGSPTSGEVTSASRWKQADALLGQGATAGRDSFAGGHPLAVLAPAPLEWLNQPAAVAELVGSALTYLAASLLSYFEPFDQALDWLTGDAGAIRRLRAELEGLAQAVGSHREALHTAAGMPQQWDGAGASAFDAYADVQQSCLAAAEQVLSVLAPNVESIARNTASARKMVVAIVASLLDELIRYVVPRLPMLAIGLGVLALPTWLAAKAAVITGMAADFLAWLLRLVSTELQTIARVMGDVAEQASGYLGQVRQLGESLKRAGIVLETGADPGNGYGVDPGSVADTMRGTDHDARDGAIIDLMAGDLNGATDLSNDRDALAELGLTPEMLTDENGFAAHVYRDRSGGIVILFEGTDFEDPQQRDMLGENVPGGIGMGPQSQMAMAIAQAIGDSDRQGDVVYGGHSLGGRLAAIASMTSGNPAVTANAAGVSDATVDYIAQQNGMSAQQLRADVDGGLVRSYHTADDILTHLQEQMPLTSGLMPDAPGTRLELGGQNPTYSADGHLADNVQAEYTREYGTDRPTLRPPR